MSQHRRVVVTGMGAVTPIGLNVGDFWTNLLAGKSGTGPITRFDATDHKCQVAAEIKEWNSELHFERKDIKNIELFCQFAIVAAREAYKDAGLAEGAFDPDMAGVIIGSGVGGIGLVSEQTLLLKEKGARRVTPFLIPRLICNEAAGMVSIDLKMRGPNICIVTACAAGTHSLGESMHIIQRGDADLMVCGGSESAIEPLAIAGFGNMGALTKDNEHPEAASCPFDKRRSGFVMGEGAALLVLEELEHARRRGARIYAELVGYGLNGDAFHITAPGPNGEGGARAIQMALRKAGMTPDEIDHVNAHGTSTPLNDRLETQGIKTVFGERAYKIPVTSNKSMIGHLIGAAGAIESVATVLTVKNDIIPPTINYQDPDPECDLDYVPNQARKAVVNAAVNSSLGFGGHNCSVIFRKFRD